MTEKELNELFKNKETRKTYKKMILDLILGAIMAFEDNASNINEYDIKKDLVGFAHVYAAFDTKDSKNLSENDYYMIKNIKDMLFLVKEADFLK